MSAPGPERWERTKLLFEEALGLEPAARDAFLVGACDGDDELRTEVASLLESFRTSSDFLEQPAANVAARQLARSREDLVGRTLGRYEILSSLGTGGMGEVFLANDSRLDRRVALKLLHRDLAANADRLRRFRQEARLVSSLNHPNIVTLYDVEDVDGVPCMATELVDGETLRQRISRGPLAPEEAVRVALQIASALAAAHDAGVVHRDVKPENVMVRRDGWVKVLDFGIAKLVEPGPLEPGAARPAPDVITTWGALGTVSYMSPEQALGGPVDARADVWSLGVVLYEMLAGRPPFRGATPGDVLSAIVGHEPEPLDSAVAGLPETLERAVARALRKSADERPQTADELAGELRSVATDASRSDAGRRAAGAWRSPLSMSFSGAAAVLAVALAIIGVRSLSPASRSVRPADARGPMTARRLDASGKVQSAAVSGDGALVAYVVDDLGKRSVWIGPTDGSGGTQIVAPTDEYLVLGLVFSPDARSLYYVRVKNANSQYYGFVPSYHGSLFRVPTSGGTPFELVGDVGSNVAFSPDGARIAYIRCMYNHGALVVGDADGDGLGCEVYTYLDDVYNLFLFQTVAWSPDGRVVACATRDDAPQTAREFVGNAEGMKLVGVRPETGEVVPIPCDQRFVAIESVTWLRDGDLLLAATEYAGGASRRSRQIWRVEAPSGQTARVSADWGEYDGLSVTADGTALVSVRETRTGNIWVAPNGDPGRARRITNGVGTGDGEGGIAWTPDGRIVFGTRPSEKNEAWVMNADGTGARRVTNDAGDVANIGVSGDGRYVVYASFAESSPHVWRVPIEGGEALKLTDGGAEIWPSCSPDGMWVAYCGTDTGTSQDLFAWVVPVDGGQRIRLTESAPTMGARFLPDGERFVYEREDGRAVVQSVSGGPPLRVLPPPREPFWFLCVTADGRSLTYTLEDKPSSEIWNWPIYGGRPRRLARFEGDTVSAAAWSRDGRQLAFSRGRVSRDIVLMRSAG
jgi:Tol biopolymer transport system component